MLKDAKTLLFGFLFFSLILPFISCGFVAGLLEEELKPKEDKYKIALSKLENAQYDEAIELFEELMREEGEKREYLIAFSLAKMAKTLSDAPRKLKNFIDSFGTLASPTFEAEKLDTKKLDAENRLGVSQKQGKGFASSFVEDAIRRVILDGFEFALVYYEKGLAKVDDSFVIDVKGIPIAFRENPVYFVGKFGELEARVLYSMIQFVRSIIYLVLSVDLDANVRDFSKANDYVKKNGGWYKFFSNFFEFGAPILVWILNRNTRFLTSPYKSYLSSAKEFLVKGAEQSILSFQILKKKIEQGDRRKGFIATLDDNFNVQFRIKSGSEEKIFSFSREFITRYSETAKEIFSHFETGEPDSIACMDAAGFIISILSYLAEIYSTTAGGELEKALPELSQALEGLATFIDIFQDFFSMCMVSRINLNKFFDNFSVRKFMPVWTYISDKISEDNIWFETECGVSSINFKEKRDIMDPIYPTYCRGKGVELVDSSHFTSPITIGAGIYEVAGHPVTQPAGDCEWDTEARKKYCINLYGGINPLVGKGIPADGTPTRIPYYLWQDPSFGKSIKIDFSQITSENVKEAIRNCGVEPEGIYMPEGRKGICVFNIVGRLWIFEE